MPSLLNRIASVFRRGQAEPQKSSEHTTSDEVRPPARPTELAARFSAETQRAQIVRACREMYKADTRAKRIVSSLARDATHGGFTIDVTNDENAEQIAEDLIRRLNLDAALARWVRLTLRDGDSFLELGVNDSNEIALVTRKPTLEIRRNSNRHDRFDDPTRAFWWTNQTWFNVEPPADATWFAEWQIIHARWDHDEESKYGSPLFSSATSVYKRMQEGETDIAVRRKTRAGMKYLHVIEGGDETAIEAYKLNNKEALDNPFAAVADFFTNQPGSITTVQGDARLQEIADVMHQVRTWWVASPVPMSLIGYGQDLNRDVLEKQKEQYDEELDPITAWVESEFVKPVLERQWLLAGIWPERLKYEVKWRAKQSFKPDVIQKVADAMLKLKALGLSNDVIMMLLERFLPGIDLRTLMLSAPVASANPERIANAADAAVPNETS